jgi:hypothetical protein
MAARIATIATVIINSIRVNPRTRPPLGAFGLDALGAIGSCSRD